MHIHLPKAIHGWREFAKEIAIIVIGVLIALGFEQLVEWVHWQHKVEDGEERLKAEGQQLYTAAVEQVAAGPCVIRQYDRLIERVMASGERLEPAPPVTGLPRASGRTRFASPLAPFFSYSARFMAPSVWDALKQDGTALHMPVQRQRRLGIVYTRVDIYNGEFRSGYRPPEVLRYPVPLDNAGRIALLVELGRVRANYMNALNYAIQIASGMRDLGYAAPPAAVEADLRQVFGSQRDYCATLGTPFADWQAVIAREPTLAQRGY